MDPTEFSLFSWLLLFFAGLLVLNADPIQSVSLITIALLLLLSFVFACYFTINPGFGVYPYGSIPILKNDNDGK